MPMTYAADAVLFALDAGELHILLIERADDSDAFPGCQALPGGLVEPDETSLSAASRELEEETTIVVPITRLTRVDVYDTPRRDPRGRVVSVAYTVLLADCTPPKAASDAKHARWLPVREALELKLAFDHREIIADALRRLGFGHLVR